MKLGSPVFRGNELALRNFSSSGSPSGNSLRLCKVAVSRELMSSTANGVISNPTSGVKGLRRNEIDVWFGFSIYTYCVGLNNFLINMRQDTLNFYIDGEVGRFDA